MKISVYAIAKNEEKFADDWVNSMKEADEIVVLDTGSTDGTAQKLKSWGVKVKTEKISPWRFDVARNKSLQMVSPDTDVCVCTDLDERFEKGWRKKLEDSFEKGVKQYRYRYTWSFNPDGSEGVVFWSEKIHSYGDFVWTHPVHEVLQYTKKDGYKSKFIDGMQLNHYPDDKKSRSNYLPLLELSVKECPDDDRNMHYLGREYMFRRDFDKAISTLAKHLTMPKATWKDERCASMRYIARCLAAKASAANQQDDKNNLPASKQNLLSQAENWLLAAIAEAPYLREPFIDLATLYYNNQNWYGVIYACRKALEIKSRSLSYINEPQSWGALPYDLLSIAFYNLKDFDNAISAVKQAIALSDEQRLKDNLNLFVKEKNL